MIEFLGQKVERRYKPDMVQKKENWVACCFMQMLTQFHKAKEEVTNHQTQWTSSEIKLTFL